MNVILRWLVLATLLSAMPQGAFGQTASVLHITVVLVGTTGTSTPVPRHVLLVSDNPATGLPRRVVTTPEGTADVKLLPGSYIVESDRPVAFEGKSYQWTEIVDMAAGRDVKLELTRTNAQLADASSVPESAPSAKPLGDDPSFLLPRYQNSVVAVWTPTSRGSGFVVDARGLVATSQRVIGREATAEVQLTPSVKVTARVLEADAVRDVAILWIDPELAASVAPLSFACSPGPAPIEEGQEIFTIGAPLRGPKSVASGTAELRAGLVRADFSLAFGTAGGPVLTGGGGVVGIVSTLEGTDDRRTGDVRIVRAEAACRVLESAAAKMAAGPAPTGTRLPVEPSQPFPADALEAGAQRRSGSVTPYQMTSSEFDVAFITPVLAYAARKKAQSGSYYRDADPTLEMDPLDNFANWSEYVDDNPPVLLIRVTPRFVEGFWTMVARGAASTQGMSLPPMKRFKSGFSRMRLLCGDAEVTPIHGFRLEQRLPDNDAIREGLYVVDPGALGPHCGTLKLVLYSEKEPDKADTRVVDPKLLEQVWEDFAPLRGQ